MISEADLLTLYKQIKPKHLLICSYTLGLGYLEQKLLKDFKRNYDTRITVITSGTGVAETLFEASSLSGIGTEYYLYQINDFPFIFHPKIFLSIDKNNHLVIFLGGANFTYPGMCLNLDVVENINHDDIGQSSKSNILSLLYELKGQIKNKELDKNISFFEDILNTIQKNEENILFINNIRKTIIRQITENIKGHVKMIRIISPYFDRDMKALKNIIKRFNNPKTEILCNKDDDQVNLCELPSNVRIHTSGETKRFLHAKIYFFYTESSVYICSGSANCTWPGIMSTSKRGNWETVILRKNIKSNYADNLWKAYSPKLLKKDDQWKYAPLKKDSSEIKPFLYFNATLNYDILTISPIENFPHNSVKGKIIFYLKESFELEEELTDQDFNSEFSFYITPEIKKRIDENPFRIEVQIFTPSFRAGQAWVMQKHKLRKSLKIRKIEEAVNRLSDNNPDGWNQTLEIIEFITSHLNYIAVKNPANSKNPKKIKKTAATCTIPTITGVYAIDEKIGSKDWNLDFYDIFDISSVINKLIERGLSINESDDEENGNDNGKSGGSKNQGEEQDVRKELKLKEDFERRKREIIDSLPNFGPIFKNSIIKPFENYLTQIETPIDNDENSRFEALLDIMTFSMRLTRFVRLDLSNQSHYSDSVNNIRSFLNETILLLGWFWRNYPLIIKKLRISKDYMKELFISSGLLQEITNYLLEIWHLNYEERFGKDVFFFAAEEFDNLFGISAMVESLQLFLQSSERFKNDGHNLLYDGKNIYKALEDIVEFKNRFETIGKAFRKHIKYLYWEDAYKLHREALQRYEENNKLPRQYFPIHKKRHEIAPLLMEKCKKEGKTDLGDNFNKNIYDSYKVIGISEILNNLEYFSCPHCNSEIDSNIFEQLKSFKAMKCINCHSFIIPVDKYPKYIFKEARDVEWEMNSEDY